MKEPNYILKFSEMDLAPKENYTLLKGMKIAVIIIWILLIFSSVILGGGLFGGLSGIAVMILIIVSIKMLFSSTTHRIKRPIEISFYDDFLVAHRIERILTPKRRSTEYYVFKYSEITRCSFRTGARRISFYGTVDCKYFDYLADGSVSTKPSHHKVTDNGIFYFYTDGEPNIDFVAEIEQHSPIKVEITNN